MHSLLALPTSLTVWIHSFISDPSTTLNVVSCESVAHLLGCSTTEAGKY